MPARNSPLDGLLNTIATLRYWDNTRRYRRAVGTWPNYIRPVHYSEKLQYRKAFDRNPLFETFSDKLKARAYAQARVPELKAPEILWLGERADDIPFGQLEPPYIIKPNHRSGARAVVHEGERPDVEDIRARGRRWLSRPYSHSEWGYAGVSPRIYAERLLPPGRNGLYPDSMNFMTFSGRVEYIRYSSEAGRAHLKTVFDRQWNQLPLRYWGGWKAADKRAPGIGHGIARPGPLERWIEIAEHLAEGTDFLRVDFYRVGDELYFGELTCYDGSGFTYNFPDGVAYTDYPPRTTDLEMGERWVLPRFTRWQMFKRLFSV